MEVALRRFIPTGLVLLLDTGLTVSGYVNTTLAYFLWALMIPAALYGAWPWLKRLLNRAGTPGETRLTDAQKRAALKDLLADALDEGHALRRTLYKEGDEIKLVGKQHVVEWVDRNRDLIEAAFGKLEAWRFLSNEGYTPEDLGWDFEPAPWMNWQEEKYLRSARMKRLHELIDRMDRLDINPDFDPQEWERGPG